jgi:urease accessory protein
LIVMMRFWFPFLVLGWLVCVAPVEAHPGHYHPPEEVDEFADEAFMQGVKHPFTGLDHLLAALAVGALAVGMGRQQGAAAAGLFFGAMAFGYAAGHEGYALPMLEQGLALAVLAVGVLLMLQQRTTMWMKWGVLAVIGLWNGGAHGLEAANAVYGVGLLSGMATIAALGAGGAMLMAGLLPAAPRYAGAAMALTGAVLVVSRLG